MHFDYSGYVRECLKMPAFVVLLFVCGMGALLWKVHKKKIDQEKFIYLPVILLGWGLFLGVVVGQLLHGGIYLIKEKESDAIQIQGYIAEIEELWIISFPRIECDYYEKLKYGDPNGYEFTINGIQCTAPVKGSLKVGDYVSVVYLPKSGYVLYISKIDHISITTE